METKEILNLKLNNDDFDEETTIGNYFENLLIKLWAERESFSGKRPFGNSGWEYDIYQPLVSAGLITGSLDEDGYIDEVDRESADKFIFKLIEYVFN